MNKFYIILFIMTNSTWVQSQSVTKDTLIDFDIFFTRHKDMRYEYLIDDNKILYHRIYNKGSTLPKAEFVRLDDTTFLGLEYFKDFDVKTKGFFTVSKTIYRSDTIHAFSTLDDRSDTTIRYFHKLIKNGKFSYIDSLGIQNIGNYVQGKKNGLWQTFIHGEDNYNECILYDMDKILTKQSSSLIERAGILLNGLWIVSQYNEFYGHLTLKKREHFDELSDFYNFEAKVVTKFYGEYSNKHTDFLSGSWAIYNKEYLELKFSNSLIAKYKILYIDKDKIILKQL